MKTLFFVTGITLFFGSTAFLCRVSPPSDGDTTTIQATELPAIAVVPATATSIIDPRDFDANLLSSLVFDKINGLRSSKKCCAILVKQDILASAADEQSRYVTQKGTLSHEQVGDRTKHTVLDRVKLYGGAFTPVGENLLFQGFKRRIYDDGREILLYPTYDEMATQMVKGWQKSKPHYENIMDCSFNCSGVAVTYSAKKDGIFAAQVFGGR